MSISRAVKRDMITNKKIVVFITNIGYIIKCFWQIFSEYVGWSSCQCWLITKSYAYMNVCLERGTQIPLLSTKMFPCVINYSIAPNCSSFTLRITVKIKNCVICMEAHYDYISDWSHTWRAIFSTYHYG